MQTHDDFSLSNTNTLQGIRVLLVEDAPDSRYLLTRFLKFAGAEVDEAEDGIEAIAKADPARHHLVLMDIQMPRLDGIAAMDRLRDQGFDRPILALTASLPASDDRYLRGEQKFDDYLTKPISQKVLIKAVQRWIA